MLSYMLVTTWNLTRSWGWATVARLIGPTVSTEKGLTLLGKAWLSWFPI